MTLQELTLRQRDLGDCALCGLYTLYQMLELLLAVTWNIYKLCYDSPGEECGPEPEDFVDSD